MLAAAVHHNFQRQESTLNPPPLLWLLLGERSNLENLKSRYSKPVVREKLHLEEGLHRKGIALSFDIVAEELSDRFRPL